MSKDLEKIKIIAEKLKIIIKLYDGDKDSFFKAEVGKTYLLDEHENIIGLNLYDCNLSDISFLKLLPNLTQLDLSGNQISDCSFLAGLPNLTQLDLSSNSIFDISVLEHLTNLTWLYLRSNQISDISVLKNLSNLNTLSLWGNEVYDITVLQYLPNLSLLDLGYNPLSDISVLKHLSNLSLLCLNIDPIADISALKNLLNLTYIDLSHNQISDISALNNLSSLSHINLIHNQISDISALKYTFSLNTLLLNDNRISDISSLRYLLNLNHLSLHKNQISDISVLNNLSNLTYIDLSNNQISDISALKKLLNLKEIDLSYNQISDISALEALIKCESINLRNNKILKIPKEILKLNLEITWKPDCKDKYLNLFKNPTEIPPVDIIKQGRAAIEAYFKSLEAGEQKAIGEVKVLLVGDGGSGKTSLVKRLFDEGFDTHQAKTDGIQIRPLEIKSDTQTVKARFWDFGGQEVMHATHQFFLSKRSLYILVLDGRKEEDAEYWLKHIESFGGNSPILIVLNKTDQNPGFDVNRRFLQDKYKEIRGFYRISCATGAGIEEFQKNLNDELQAVEFIRTVWAKSWFNVKSCLETLNKHFISFQDYRDICSKESIGDTSAQDTLVGFLNDLGVVVHFRDLNLSAMYVLEPKWVTEAVYKIINSKDLAENKGVLNLCLLDKILCQKTDSDYCYPCETYHYIINLMKKFELCYTINDDTVLIPGLLAIQEPEFEFDYRNSLKFRLEYDFLPKSVMPRFIVKRHKDIKNNLQWRTGVVLEDKSFHAIAVVKADMRDRKIEIFVIGNQKRDYFSVIRKTLSDINNSFEKLSVKELIPLDDHPEIAIEYEELLGYERAGRDDYFIGKLGKSYSVSKLLNGIEKKEDRQKRASNIINVYHGDHSESHRSMSVGNVEDSNLIAGDENTMR